MKTDACERGLERVICMALAGHPCDPVRPGQVPIQTPSYGESGWIGGHSHDYDREYFMDLVQLRTFLLATQPEAAEAVNLK